MASAPKTKPTCSASHRSERQTHLTKAKIGKAVEDENEKDESERFNILHNIVGDAMDLHSTSWYHC